MWKVYNKKIYKKIDLTSIKKNIFFGYSINMPNPQQNKIQNEIEQIKKEINLL